MAKAAARSRKPVRTAAPPLPIEPAERTQTTLRLDVETLTSLKKLAADRRCRVNDLVVEAVDALLDRAGR